MIVTITLCTFIIWKGDWSRIWYTLQNSNLFLIIIVFVCMVFCVTISTFKWKVLLSIHKNHFSFLVLHKYYFTSVFFNNFLPTNIGGDAYRIYKTLQNSHFRAGALIAVFMERITGIWALVILGSIGYIVICLQGIASNLLPWVVLAFLVITMITSIACVIVLSRVMPKLLTNIRILWKLKRCMEHLGDYRYEPVKTLQVVLISFFFHVFTLAWMIVLIWALGADISIFKLVIAVMISNFVALLPVSINGIGVMDGAFVYVIGKYGLEYEHALMFMLFNRALVVPISLIGGIFYLRDKHSSKIVKLKEESL